jgi:hypothetical protein
VIAPCGRSEQPRGKTTSDRFAHTENLQDVPDSRAILADPAYAGRGTGGRFALYGPNRRPCRRLGAFAPPWRADRPPSALVRTLTSQKRLQEELQVACQRQLTLWSTAFRCPSGRRPTRRGVEVGVSDFFSTKKIPAGEPNSRREFGRKQAGARRCLVGGGRSAGLGLFLTSA